jgi:hypothetical protein
MRETSTSDIERINVIILLVGSLASIVAMRDFVHFFSFAAASAIMVLNFRLLRRLSNPALGQRKHSVLHHRAFDGLSVDSHQPGCDRLQP